MASKIDWTDETWNPIVGCCKVSEGCRNCYAEKMAARLAGGLASGSVQADYQGVMSGNGHWSGETVLRREVLERPLKRKKPTTYFVNSMGDLFHESAPFEWVAAVFGVMAATPQHTYQVLTKRPEWMVAFFEWIQTNWEGDHDSALFCNTMDLVYGPLYNPGDGPQWIYDIEGAAWPLPNVWLGVTAENQEMADKRIPHLIKMAELGWPTFASIEPMLGHVILPGMVKGCRECDHPLDWVICGGESGPGARPMHPDWVRSLRDQCQEADLPFFFKQWGAWMPSPDCEMRADIWICPDGSYGDPDRKSHPCHTAALMDRVGKKKAGCLLDGREHRAFQKWRGA